jgi:hypothetical protein
MRPSLLLAAVGALALAACVAPVATRPPAPGSPTEPADPSRPIDRDEDVRLGGESIVGTWSAIAIEGDDAATRDLNRGIMEQTLLVRRRGSVILTGRDRREGSGAPVTLGGQIHGDRMTFAGLPGAAALSMRGRRLRVQDPRGRVTVFARVGR